MKIQITEKQERFLSATADEVLYGGAAGGGKSYGQLIDAFLYALRHQGSRQLILRRTFPDLERSLILTSLLLYDRAVASYSASVHRWRFRGGSSIEFAYLDSEHDLPRYQGAEYDVIRFDELTHFTEGMYVYLFSRCRGANDFPKQVKCTGNPGGVGHQWVRERFVDIGPPGSVHAVARGDGTFGTRVFIPARVQDNPFLMAKDSGYLSRLQMLADNDRRALLHGDWDIAEGQLFSEFRRDIHVVEPVKLEPHWRRYVTMDYGLDMLAAYCIALTDGGKAYVYKEVHEPGLIVSAAAERIRDMVGDDAIYQYLAPPDLWARRQETGRSVADIFAACGIGLDRTSNDRVDGWMAVHEWLRPRTDEQGIPAADLRIFSNCVNLIRTIPALQHDPRRPGDALREPHAITHAPDALRGFCVYATAPFQEVKKERSFFDSFDLGRDPTDIGRERIAVL